MNLAVYDLTLLGIFVIFLAVFLSRKKKNIQKQGLLLLYRTTWGIKLINNVGRKYKKLLEKLSYVSIGMGYLLMVCMVYLFGKIVYIYITNLQLVRAIAIPPIMPLIPYIDKIVPNLGLPPFYFTYWIIIIAIIAIPHEFAHGIFASLKKVRIKKTGFGFFPFFLPVFLAAFVELDEKNMEKKSKFSQMAILSAGTFANVLTAIFFFIIMWLFFSLSFAPTGIIFNDYAYDIVEIAGITMVNGMSITNTTYEKISDLTNDEGLNKIQAGNRSYVATKEFLDAQGEIYNYTFLYYDSPAINADLDGAITNINDVKITSFEVFLNELSKYSPGDEIIVKTIIGEEIKEYKIELGENPNEEGPGYLGVGFIDTSRSGIMGKIINFISFKKLNIHYESKFEVAWFIYHLLWWLVLISFSVALINMLPVGIFDGGRFFYLTILALTKSKKKAEKTFKFVTWFFLFLLLVLMVFWAISFF